MNYNELVRYIREDGCRVYVYNKKNSIYGGIRGTFDVNEHGPIICVANAQIGPDKQIETLLHEYGHFLQWQDGFMQALDGVVDSYELTSQWITGKIELSNREVEICRRAVLTMEYDAEKRGYEQGCMMQPEHWRPKFYLRGAAAYMDSIKWEFFSRTFTTSSPSRKGYSPKILTLEELYAPLSQQKIKTFRRKFNRKGVGLSR